MGAAPMAGQVAHANPNSSSAASEVVRAGGVGAPSAARPEIPTTWNTARLVTENSAAENPPAPGAADESRATPPDGSVLEPARIVGMVGDQPILAGEIQGNVNIIVSVQLKDMPPEEREKAAAQIETFRRQLFNQLLKAEINTKLGYIDFMRSIPPERHSDLQKKVRSAFERELEEVRAKLAAATTDEQKAELAQRNLILARLALLMQIRKLDNLGELDATLRQEGSSLEKQIRAYGEQKLQQMAVMKSIRTNVEVTHEQMLEYYREHQADFAFPAKARWEQLSVRFDKFPNEEAAMAAISQMGNDVYLGGAPLSAVAKRSSQEPNAESGGQHDWTRQGSLASKPLEEAIFSLPLNRLSQIIRDERGLHIVRVLERDDAGHTPFLDAQTEIKEKIRLQRRNHDVQEYFEQAKSKTKVWTILDDPQNATAEDSSPPAGP